MKNWKLPLSLGCLVLGLLMAIQFKQQEKEGFPLLSYRSLDLVRLVKDSERNRRELQAQVEELRGRLAEYEFVRSGRGNASKLLVHELERARLEAGLIPVKGAGIEVILDDSKQRPRPAEDDYFYLVHDVDLNQLVNELWAIGAEAVAINRERIVANSAIRCVGPTILVNTRRLSPPYHVLAVGDPESLAVGLKMRGGFMDAMAVSMAHGVTVSIAKKDQVTIPAFSGPVIFRYAAPAVR